MGKLGLEACLSRQLAARVCIARIEVDQKFCIQDTRDRVARQQEIML